MDKVEWEIVKRLNGKYEIGLVKFKGDEGSLLVTKRIKDGEIDIMRIEHKGSKVKLVGIKSQIKLGMDETIILADLIEEASKRFPETPILQPIRMDG